MIIIFLFLLTLSNNKIFDTEKKKSVHVFIGLSTGGTAQQRAPIIAGPRHRSINVKTNNTIYKQQTMFRPKLWAASQVKHIDLKDRGSSGK